MGPETAEERRIRRVNAVRGREEIERGKLTNEPWKLYTRLPSHFRALGPWYVPLHGLFYI